MIYRNVLIFSIVDFDWNPSSPWTISSMSDDGELGGGTLQIWRVSDLVYRDDPEFLASIEEAAVIQPSEKSDATEGNSAE